MHSTGQLSSLSIMRVATYALQGSFSSTLLSEGYVLSKGYDRIGGKPSHRRKDESEGGQRVTEQGAQDEAAECLELKTKDKGQPGWEGNKFCPQGLGGDAPSQGPSWNALRGRASLVCSLPGAASRTTQGYTSVPLISFYEKSTVRAELLFHCCYCLLITPPSFFKLGNQIKSSQAEINL